MLWIFLYIAFASVPRLQAQDVSQSANGISQAGPGSQSLYFGSVPNGKATQGSMGLSLKEAIQRGLKYNLAVLIGSQESRSAQGARWKALSSLLPNLKAGASETIQQINLQALGFPGFPGIHPIIGPFSVFDVRGYLNQPVINFEALAREKAATAKVKAVDYSYQNARDLVVLAVAGTYLQVDANQARVNAAQVQVKTAESLFEKARDMHTAGLVPSIDQLRAQVELQSRRQQLLAAENGFDTSKIVLARVIGLPLEQAYSLTTQAPYAQFTPPSLEQAMQIAVRQRADYQSAIERTRQAEQAKKAAERERWPSIDFASNYGDIGIAPGVSHGTFVVAGSLTIPIFQGGKIRGEILEADAELNERREHQASLRADIEQEVRTALLDLKTASSQVQVARSSEDLAQQTLDQAEDRFAAGVADNLEVVQAQDAVATADESYIQSLFQYNLAKATLAHALGVAEKSALDYLGGQ